MEIRTILWPTDLSRNSMKATRHVMALADKHQARVLLLYVGVDLCSYFPAYGNFPSDTVLNEFRDWELENAKKKMQEICEGELKGCPLLETKLVMGDPVEMILETAKSEKADIIVITSHGQGREGQEKYDPTIGSVARRVITHAPVPVAVINPLTGEE